MRAFAGAAICISVACAAPFGSTSRSAATPADLPWIDIDAASNVETGRVLRSPSLAVVGDEGIIAGNAVLPGSVTAPPVLYIATLSGARIQPPPGSYRFYFPRGLFDSTGIYHLVWAESDQEPRPSRALPNRYNALWHAAYARGTWSTPAKILSADAIAWESQTSPVVIDTNGCIHIVVPVFPRSGTQGLAYVRGYCEPWNVSRIARAVTYASVAATSPGSVVVAFTGLDTLNPQARNTVHIVRSDGGGPWKPIAKIRIGSARTRPTRIWAVGDRDRLQVAWLQNASHPEQQSVVYVESRDAGHTWQDTSISAPTDGMVTAVRFAAHPCGVTAVVEMLDSTTVTLVEAALSQPSPALKRIFPLHAGSGDAAVGFRRDSLLLFASVLPSSGGDAVARFAVRRACLSAR